MFLVFYLYLGGIYELSDGRYVLVFFYLYYEKYLEFCNNYGLLVICLELIMLICMFFDFVYVLGDSIFGVNF